MVMLGSLVHHSLITKTMVPNHPLLPAYSRNNKENNLFKDLLQSILVKGVAIETSPANHITIMA
jgi:hypothetical protein